MCSRILCNTLLAVVTLLAVAFCFQMRSIKFTVPSYSNSRPWMQIRKYRTPAMPLVTHPHLSYKHVCPVHARCMTMNGDNEASGVHVLRFLLHRTPILNSTILICAYSVKSDRRTAGCLVHCGHCKSNMTKNCTLGRTFPLCFPSFLDCYALGSQNRKRRFSIEEECQ